MEKKRCIFKRKIDIFLENWKTKKDKNPLLIVGIRQCGKTKFKNKNV